MPLHFPFDFKSPDYSKVFRHRLETLAKLKADPGLLAAAKAFYRENPAQFIIDWGMTQDPKLVERGLPSAVPFLLFPKQEEWVNEVVSHWHAQKPMITEKTRQMGFSWLAMATACTLCLFHDGMSIGFGSRKEMYVDTIGDPKSLFHKGREFMSMLPPIFRGGWSAAKHAPHMRIMFPGTNASITGEAGDQIGRGATTSIYFVDESAFLERPHLVDAALSQTTNCRLDISTPNGMANPFAQRRHSGRIDVFTFHWWSDPRKDQAWYDKQVQELDPVVVAQEIDISYTASVAGVVIPHDWVKAAIDAHVKLGIEVTGVRSGSLDVADEGVDLNCYAGKHGILLEYIHAWSGVGSDPFKTVEKAFQISDEEGYRSFRYDGDGLGANVRGDARVINEQRAREGKPLIEADRFRGSEGVLNPDKPIPTISDEKNADKTERLNKDYFKNQKAQGWFALRMRFMRTYRAVQAGKAPEDTSGLISLSSKMPALQKLVQELSQPTYAEDPTGKMVIVKTPDGMRSPNYGDACMMVFAPTEIKARSRWD